VRLCAVNVPVHVSGMLICPGEILHGDQHGILQVPRAAVATLPQLAAQIRASEQDTIAWARSTGFSHEALLARRPTQR
jgi:regulator of RNase E activity RraA